MFEFLYNSSRKIMLLGAGFSSCSRVVAALAGLDPWAIPQVRELYRQPGSLLSWSAESWRH